MLLEVGALTATLPPFQGQKNKLQPDNASVSRNDRWEEDSCAVTVKLALLHLSSGLAVGLRFAKDGEDVCTYILMYATMMTAKSMTAQVDVMRMTFAEKEKKKSKITKLSQNDMKS